MIAIKLVKAADYASETYGIKYVSAYVYKVIGNGVHNRHFPHRVQVWDNSRRPNPHPGEVRYTQYGTIGGDGQYLDPNNKGTDSRFSVTLSSECVAISAHGDGTGTKASGQVYSSDTLTTGETVVLIFPEAHSELVRYTVTAQRLRDPELIPVV